MWFFKKKKGEKKNTQKDTVAYRIAQAMVVTQAKFAKVMTSCFSKVPAQRMKLYTFLFCLLGFGLSLYIVTAAILNIRFQSNFKIEHLSVPKIEDKKYDTTIEPNILVDEESWNKIQYFKRYIDSLRENGSKEVDSILGQRPGLMDSIAMLEEIYYSQKTK